MTIAPLLLALLTAASSPASDSDRSRLARLPRRVVRTVPQGAPGRRAVDPQGISDQVDRYRRGTRAPAALPRRQPSRRSSWSIASRTRARPDRRSSVRGRAGAILQGGRSQGSAAGQLQMPTSARATIAGRRDDETTTNPSSTDRQRHDDDDRRSRKTIASESEPAFANPKPWETVVRIRVHRQPIDRLRLGDRHLQHARRIADSDLCATSSSWRGESKPIRRSSRAGS